MNMSEEDKSKYIERNERLQKLLDEANKKNPRLGVLVVSVIGFMDALTLGGMAAAGVVPNELANSAANKLIWKIVAQHAYAGFKPEDAKMLTATVESVLSEYVSSAMPEQAMADGRFIFNLPKSVN